MKLTKNFFLVYKIYYSELYYCKNYCENLYVALPSIEEDQSI